MIQIGQVQCDRLLPQDLDPVPIAKEALQEVCQFASVCLIGTTRDEVRSELVSWWKETGKRDVLPGGVAGFDLDEDDAVDEEDVEEKPPWAWHRNTKRS